MPVLATDGSATRFFTCAQWNAMDSGQTTWDALSINCTGEFQTDQMQAPYASYNLGSLIVNSVSRRSVQVLVDDPGGSLKLTGKISTQSFFVEPAAGDRFVSLGTTFNGTEILDNELIADGRAFEYTWFSFYEDPTFYITTEDALSCWFVFDVLTANPNL